MWDYQFKPGYPSYEAYKEMINKLRGTLQSELRLTAGGESKFIERQLRPEDIGKSTPEFTFTPSTASAWNTLVNTYTIADNRYIGIYGIRYLSTDDPLPITQLKITKAGKDVRYWTIQGCNYVENPAMYFHDPITVEQNVPLTIQGYNATATVKAQKIMILGVVMEKEGILVSR